MPKLNELSLVELKAVAYDLILQQKTTNSNLQIVEQLILDNIEQAKNKKPETEQTEVTN